MDPRTLRKIVRKIISDPNTIVTRINGYRYYMVYDGNIVFAEPLGKVVDGAYEFIREFKAGDPRTYNKSACFVSTHVKFDSDAYLEGGEVYRKAVEWCHEVLNEIKKLSPGKVS